MPILHWTEELAVGIEALDDDHRRLIDAINDLHEVLGEEQDNQAGRRVLRDLIAVTEDHFVREQAYMQRHRPDFAETHALQYAALLEQVRAAKEGLARGEWVLTGDLLAQQLAELYSFTMSRFCLKLKER